MRIKLYAASQKSGFHIHFKLVQRFLYNYNTCNTNQGDLTSLFSRNSLSGTVGLFCTFKCSNFHIHILTSRVIVHPDMNNKINNNYNCNSYICRKPKLYAQNELKMLNNEPNLGYRNIIFEKSCIYNIQYIHRF